MFVVICRKFFILVVVWSRKTLHPESEAGQLLRALNGTKGGKSFATKSLRSLLCFFVSFMIESTTCMFLRWSNIAPKLFREAQVIQLSKYWLPVCIRRGVWQQACQFGDVYSPNTWLLTVQSHHAPLSKVVFNSLRTSGNMATFVDRTPMACKTAGLMIDSSSPKHWRSRSQLLNLHCWTSLWGSHSWSWTSCQIFSQNSPCSSIAPRSIPSRPSLQPGTHSKGSCERISWASSDAILIDTSCICMCSLDVSYLQSSWFLCWWLHFQVWTAAAKKLWISVCDIRHLPRWHTIEGAENRISTSMEWCPPSLNTSSAQEARAFTIELALRKSGITRFIGFMSLMLASKQLLKVLQCLHCLFCCSLLAKPAIQSTDHLSCLTEERLRCGCWIPEKPFRGVVDLRLRDLDLALLARLCRLPTSWDLRVRQSDCFSSHLRKSICFFMFFRHFLCDHASPFLR